MIHFLFPLEELPVGEMRSVDVDGLSVVVARPKGDKVYALRDVCPHAGAKLSHGNLLQTFRAGGVGPEGGYELADKFAIFCPWHGYEMDVENGQCLADSRSRVKTYTARVIDGMVTVER